MILFENSAHSVSSRYLTHVFMADKPVRDVTSDIWDRQNQYLDFVGELYSSKIG